MTHNICVAYPNRNLTYSETFVKNHIQNIEPEFILTGGKWPYLTGNNLSIFKFPLNINIIRAIIKLLFPSKYHKIYSSSLELFLITNSINIVFAEYGPVGARMADGCKKAGVKLITHFHGYDAFHFKTLKVNAEFYKILFKYAKNIIVVSEDMRHQLISLGLDDLKIKNITCGVDIDKFKGADPSSKDKIFLSVGRFAEKKAPDKTILAFKEVLSIFNNVKLKMAGAGSLLNYCKALALKLNINHAISFLGILTPDQIAALHKEVYCFLQHSVKSPSGDSEGLPTTVLEALSSGLPVISTKHAGIVEAVRHEYNGFLVDEGDVKGMAEYMKILIGNPELVKTMGINARKTIIESYSLGGQIKKLKDVIYSE